MYYHMLLLLHESPLRTCNHMMLFNIPNLAYVPIADNLTILFIYGRLWKRYINNQKTYGVG